MKHRQHAFPAGMFALLFALPLIAGCIYVDGQRSTEEDKAGLEVYAEYEKDPAASTARFLQAWKTGAPQASRGVERSRWIAITGLLANRKQGPVNEFKHFLVESLDDTKPAIGVQAAREMANVAGTEVVNALLDKVESPDADAALRDAAAMSLIEKIDMQVFSHPEGDREALLDRLGSACTSQQRTSQLSALCARAKPALAKHAEENRVDACVGRPVESPADCIREATK